MSRCQTAPSLRSRHYFSSPAPFLLRLALGRISVTMCEKSTVPAWSHNDDDILLKSTEKGVQIMLKSIWQNKFVVVENTGKSRH